MAGLQFNDRQLGSEVRTLTLNEIKKVLKKGKGRFYEAVVIRLSGNILPRLNEVSGENGGPISVEISEAISKKHESHYSAETNSRR